MYESDDIKVMHCFGTDVKNRYLKPYEHLYAMDTGAHYVCDKNGNPQAIVTASTNSSGGIEFDAAAKNGIRQGQPGVSRLGSVLSRWAIRCRRAALQPRKAVAAR